MYIDIPAIRETERRLESLQTSTCITISYGNAGITYYGINKNISSRGCKRFSTSSESDAEKWIDENDGVVVSNSNNTIIIFGQEPDLSGSPFSRCHTVPVRYDIVRTIFNRCEGLRLFIDLPQYCEMVYILVPSYFDGYENGEPVFVEVEF